MKQLKLLSFCLFLSVSSSAQGIINTIGGDGGAGYTGDGGQATAAKIEGPRRATLDAAGNIYFVHQGGHRVRKITPAGIITTVAGTGTPGFSGDGGPATAAQLNVPSDVIVDSAGNLYIADLQNYRVRKVDGTTGIISTIAGNGQNGITGNGGPATAASIFIPYALTLDHGNNLYIAGNAFIRKVDPNGIITTVCGLGGNMSTGDGGPAINADINVALSLCVDSDDNLYILGGARLRMINSATGIINTVAGNGTYAFGGDGGPALAAAIAAEDIEMDRYDNLYLADGTNARVRVINTQGIIESVAGTGVIGSTGDGGPPLLCKLGRAAGIGIDTCGNFFITDYSLNRIRKVTYPNCILKANNIIATSASVILYPNPATGIINIASGFKADQVILSDALGKVIRYEGFKGQENILDVSKLNPGVYFATIISGSERKFEKIIIH
ncbi:MAG TPA: T9SS type A sorting domain-containing protein [Flavipsychrobacter sp.]|nr:T9SS type A sorting domain-containing protein [Flavipsychrobacter sp.]